MTGAQISIETGSEAHIQGDMAKAFVLAYKTFVVSIVPIILLHWSIFTRVSLVRLPSSCFLKAKAIYLLKSQEQLARKEFLNYNG